METAIVDERGIVLEDGLDGVVGEVRRSDGFEKAEALGLLPGISRAATMAGLQKKKP